MTTPSPERVARQHMQHGQSRRKSRMYYMRHRSAIKHRSKKRYHRVHNTGAFRMKARHRRLHPAQHHRIHASEISLEGINLPFWSPVYGDACVVNIQGDLVGYLPDPAPPGTEPAWVCYDEFLEDVLFLGGEADIDLFFRVLDAEMGVEGLDEDLSLEDDA